MCWEALSMGKARELQLSKWKVTEVEAQRGESTEGVAPIGLGLGLDVMSEQGLVS